MSYWNEINVNSWLKFDRKGALDVGKLVLVIADLEEIKEEIEQPTNVDLIMNQLLQIQKSCQFLDKKISTKLISIEGVCFENRRDIQEIKLNICTSRSQTTDKAVGPILNNRRKALTSRWKEPKTEDLSLTDEITIRYISKPLVQPKDAPAESKWLSGNWKMNGENKGTTSKRYREQRAQIAIKYFNHEMIFLPLNRNSDHWFVAVINGAKEKIQILHSLCMDKSNYAADKDLNNIKMSTLQNGRTRKSQHGLFAQCKCLNIRTGKRVILLVVWLVYAEVYGALEWKRFIP
uniref:Ubiquitin-like protease family profile domain-containing protein n=1 Tax=Oryza punctata TaxID=4537 RepID=A0A0E0K1M4_ORYPU